MNEEKIAQIKKEIVIDRRICIGIFIVGAISFYEKDEIMKHKAIGYVLKVLKKKNFSLKNGRVEDNLWSNAEYVRNQLRINPKKAKEITRKFEQAVRNKTKTENRWTAHIEIANNAWMKATKKFSENNAITTNQLVLALLRKDEATMKFYGFNAKKLKAFAGKGTNGYIFSSSRVASTLLEILDQEIAYFNYNKRKTK